MSEIPRGAVGRPHLVLEDEAEDLGDPEGGDREVVGAQPHADPAHAPGDDRAREHRRDHARRHREAEAAGVTLGGGGGHDGGGVGADREEARHPGVEEPGEAPVDVEARG